MNPIVICIHRGVYTEGHKRVSSWQWSTTESYTANTFKNNVMKRRSFILTIPALSALPTIAAQIEPETIIPKGDYPFMDSSNYWDECWDKLLETYNDDLSNKKTQP